MGDGQYYVIEWVELGRNILIVLEWHFNNRREASLTVYKYVAKDVWDRL